MKESLKKYLMTPEGSKKAHKILVMLKNRQAENRKKKEAEKLKQEKQ